MHNSTSPATGDAAIESEIQAKGKTAPRVTPADLLSNIVGEHYFTAAQAVRLLNPDSPLFLLTFCVLVLKNGFTVTGESACASPENFDKTKGQTFAYEDAIRQLWPLMGFALRDRLIGDNTGTNLI